MASPGSAQTSPESKSPPQSEGPCPPQAAPDRPLSLGRVWTAVTVNWLVPGMGYLVAGDRRRGWALVLLLNGAFLLGLGLRGGVVVPDFNPRSAYFNVINVLSFTVQMGGGGPSLLSLAAHQMAPSGSHGAVTRFLAGEESAATFDLGSFHLLLVGALNYFACCAIYDRYRPRPLTGPKGGR